MSDTEKTRTCKVNEFQTPPEMLFLDKYPEEIQTQFWDFVDNVPFIKWLISPDRPRAKDLPRDSDGKIIVDITKPHILENMDYFRQPALHYKKYGRYTDLRPNKNPNSQYMKWLKEEVRRCWYGYVRESDGEWVTGNMYFYLNYYRMEITEEIFDEKTGKKKKKGNRRIDFPESWEGVYWRFHYIEQAQNGGIFDDFEGGKGGCEISSRGKSKSHSMAAIVDKYFTLGESKDVKENVKSLILASSSEYLDADGILNKFSYANEFLIQRPEIQFPKKRIKASMKEMEWKSGYYDLDTQTEKGTLNQVFGVTTGDNSIGKIRGKRMHMIVVEEFGSYQSVLEMYNIMKPSWIEGDTAFGFCYMVGTTSEKESDFAGASEIVYSPKGYRMYALPNNWDLNGLGRKTITFFFPGYINYKGCYNHDGVSDVTMSLLKILIERYNVKYNTTDVNSITRTIAEIPITPQEALLRVRASMFPVAQLNERVNQLDNNPDSFDDVYVGDLVVGKNGNIEFQITNDEPIRSFPHDANNKQRGALEIFKMPQRGNDGKIPPFRYIASADPIDADNSETMSLYSIFVLDMFTDEIVAEYTGRPVFANEGHDMLRRLCLFYNATACYEQNLKGIYAYFQKTRCLHLLCDTPDYLKDKGLVKSGTYGNTMKGVLATAAVNNYANQLVRDWLMELVPVIDDNNQEQMVQRLYKVKNRAFLKECILYTPHINVDRIRSFGLLMLYRQQFIVMYQGDIAGHKKDNRADDPNYAGNDEFFKKNYTDKFAFKETD